MIVELIKSIGTQEIRCNIQGVSELLNSGIDVNLKDSSGSTALHYASYYGLDEIAELLIMRGADVNLQDSEERQTPLIVAAGNGRIKVSKLLLQHEADINAQNRYGRTALHRAAFWRYYETTKLLLDWNADYEIEDECSNTPKQMTDNVRIKNLFIEKIAQDTDGKSIDAGKLKPKT